MKKPMLAALVPVAAALACSSMPGMPSQGSGSSFSLATVEYVNQRNAAMRSEVLQQLRNELPSAVEAAMVDDRRRIGQVQEMVLEHEQELEAMIKSLAEARASLASAVEQLQAASKTFNESIEEFRKSRDSLQAEMAALPTEMLALLRAALDRHLEATRPPAEPAGQ